MMQVTNMVRRGFLKLAFSLAVLVFLGADFLKYIKEAFASQRRFVPSKPKGVPPSPQRLVPTEPKGVPPSPQRLVPTELKRVPPSLEKFGHIGPKPVPSSVKEAIKSHDPDTAVAFILKHQSMASRSDLNQRIQMLRIIRENMTRTESYARSAIHGGADYEKAVLLLVKGAERNPKELSTMVQAIGGKPWLRQQVKNIRDSRLRGIANKALRD